MTNKPKTHKKVLTPEEERNLGPMLKAAEQAAKAGFDPNTKQINPNIYGSTNPKFDLAKEMQQDQIELNQAPMPLEQMEQQALDAVAAAGFGQNPELEDEFVFGSEETKQEEVDPDEPPEDPVERLKWAAVKLQAFDPKAPNASVLLQWKQMHGNVFILSISDFVFIYRYLKRQEWNQIQAKPEWPKLDDDKQERLLVYKCLLWPRLDNISEAGLPGNAIGMLADQIRMQSMFLNPQVVAGMTLKL